MPTRSTLKAPVEEILPLLWSSPPEAWSLRDGEIHVWSALLDVPGFTAEKLISALNGEEKERAAKFRFEQEQRRWAAGRGLLRRILSRYLKCDPACLRFDYGPQGKPVLAGPHSGSLVFNLSHSGKLALFAFCRGGNVGVDVERICRISEMDGIAQRFFTASERARFRAAPTEEKQRTFFTIWTAKEAVLKCSGAGIAGLEKANANAFSGWLQELNPAPGFVGHIAAQTSPNQVQLWQWNADS